MLVELSERANRDEKWLRRILRTRKIKAILKVNSHGYIMQPHKMMMLVLEAIVRQTDALDISRSK